MARKKLERFVGLTSLPNVIQFPTEVRGDWGANYFNNDHPITLELACGKGEYTLELAQRFPQRNFIGVDIKGARLWNGAKAALERDLKNVAFLRTYVERLAAFFPEHEVDELWITFPDPYPKKSKAKKRLTSPRFLNLYRSILRRGGMVHLKTDDRNLFHYTLEKVKAERGVIHEAIENLYHAPIDNEVLAIPTTYELKHLQKGRTIQYVRFSLAVEEEAQPGINLL